MKPQPEPSLSSTTKSRWAGACLLPHVREHLRWARQMLARAGCDSPSLDAELLAAHLLEIDRTRLWMEPERALSEAQQRRFRELVERRARREPLPHILGEWEFFGLTLQVSPDVLIPRPETETLVEVCLSLSSETEAIQRKVQMSGQVKGRIGSSPFTGEGQGGGVRWPPTSILPHKGGGDFTRTCGQEVVGRGPLLCGLPTPPKRLRRLDRSPATQGEVACPPPKEVRLLGVEVGTGSGAVSIAIAHALTASMNTSPYPVAAGFSLRGLPSPVGVHIFATDSSEAALSIAKENCIRHHLSDSITLLHGDLLEPLEAVVGRGPLPAPSVSTGLLPSVGRGFHPPPQEVDFIIANLPYIPTGEIPTLPPEVRDWEPRSAIDGGADGLDAIRRLIAQAPHWLHLGGFIALEISPEQTDEVQRLLSAHNFGECEIVPDLSGRPRVAIAKKQSAN